MDPRDAVLTTLFHVTDSFYRNVITFLSVHSIKALPLMNGVCVNSLHVIKVKTPARPSVLFLYKSSPVTEKYRPLFLRYLCRAKNPFGPCTLSQFLSPSFSLRFVVSSSMREYHLFVQKYDRYADFVEACVRSSKKKKTRKKEKKNSLPMVRLYFEDFNKACTR